MLEADLDGTDLSLEGVAIGLRRGTSTSSSLSGTSNGSAGGEGGALETDLREGDFSFVGDTAIVVVAVLVDTCESVFFATSGVCDLRAAAVKLYSGILLLAALP